MSRNIVAKQKAVKNAGTSLTVGNTYTDSYVFLNATGGSSVLIKPLAEGSVVNFVVSNTGAHVITTSTGSLIGCLSVASGNTNANLVLSGSTSISTTVGSAIGDSWTIVSNGSKLYIHGNVKNTNAVVIA